MGGAIQQITPSQSDKQNVYRQVNTGWIPFMSMAPKALNAVKFAAEHSVNPNAKAGDFKWGPTFGGGKPWGFTKEYDDTHASNTMLPYIHWLYKGNARSWAIYSLLSNPDGNISQGLGGGFGINLARNILIGGRTGPGGVRKPLPQNMFAAGKEGYDVRKSSNEKQQEIMRLFAEDIIPDGNWLMELQKAASENKVPVGKRDINKNSIWGGKQNKPSFNYNTGDALSWRLSDATMKQAAAELTKNVAGDLMGLYSKVGGDDFKPRKFDKMDAEEKEAVGIGILMQKWIDDGNTISFEAPQQFKKEAGDLFKLPSDLKKATGIGMNIDVSSESMEGQWLFKLAQTDERLGKLITMDVKHSLGIEITMMDIKTKGGFQAAFDGKNISDIDAAIQALTDFNKEMLDRLQQLIVDHGNDLGGVHLSLSKGISAKDRKGKMEDQMRQAASRFVDIAYGSGGGEGGYEFISPMEIGGRNYLVSMGYNLELDANGNYQIIPQTYDGKTISFVDMGESEKTVEVDGKEVRSDMLAVMDLVGSVVYGNDGNYINYRTTEMFGDIMQESYQDEDVDALLGTHVEGFIDTNLKQNMFPTALVGFKLPSELAQDFSDALMERLNNQADKGEAMSFVRTKMHELTNAWKNKTGANSWESVRSVIQEGQNPFGSSTGSGDVSQFVFPMISQGGTAAGMSSVSKRPWSPVTI